MSHLEFLNQDNELEIYPTEESLHAIREAVKVLEDLGFAMICQMCNEPPTLKQIKDRTIRNFWKCEKCNTNNDVIVPV